MQKNLEDFLIDINENDKIKNEILNLKNRFNFEDSSKNNQINFIKNNIIPIARKYGYNFTAEDYLKLKEKKLNQEDLETISGGKFSPKAIAIASGLTLVSLGGIVSSTFSSENSKPSSNIQQVSLTRRIQNSKNNRTPNRRTVGRNTKNISRKNFGYKSNFTKNQVKRQTNQQTKRQDFTKKQQSKKIAPTHFKNRFEEKQKITNNLNKNQTKTNNLNKNQTRTNNFSNANKLKIEENKPNVTKFKSNEEIFKSYCKIAKDQYGITYNELDSSFKKEDVDFSPENEVTNKESKKNLVDCTNKFEEENKIFKKELKEFENKKNKALENNNLQELRNILNFIKGYRSAYDEEDKRYIEKLPLNKGKILYSKNIITTKKVADIQKEFSEKKLAVKNSGLSQNERELKIFEIETEEYDLIQKSNFSHNAYENFIEYCKKNKEIDESLNNLYEKLYNLENSKTIIKEKLKNDTERIEKINKEKENLVSELTSSNKKFEEEINELRNLKAPLEEGEDRKNITSKIESKELLITTNQNKINKRINEIKNLENNLKDTNLKIESLPEAENALDDLNSFLQESENIANKIFKEREDFLNNESRKIEEENQKISDNQDKCIIVLQKKLKEIQSRTNNFSNANKLKIEENKPNVTKFKSNEEIFKSYCKIAKDQYGITYNELDSSFKKEDVDFSPENEVTNKESKKNLVDCTNKFEEENKIFKKELKEFENKKNKALENNDFQELQNILDDEEFNIITPYNRKIRDTFNAFRSQGLKYIEQLPSNTGKNKIRSSLKNEMKKAEDIQKEFSKKKFDIINSHIDQNEKELKIFEIEAEEYRLIQESNFSHDAYKNFVKYYKKHEETNKLLNNLLINFSKKRDNLKSLNKTKITTKEKEDIKSAFKENLNSFLQESENIANKIFKEREDFLNNESRKIEEENQKISDNQDKCITVLQKKLKEINDKKQQ